MANKELSIFQNTTYKFMITNETLLAGMAQMGHPSQKASTKFRNATFYCAFLMLTCCLVGLIGNILSFWVFTRRSMRPSPINVLLAALSAVDTAVLVTAVSVFVVPSLNTFLYYVDPGTLYRIIVSGFYQASMIAQTCSVWTFVLISLERYIAVCSPFNARQRLTVRKARAAFAVILMLAFVYNIPRFFEYRSDEKRGYAPLLRSNFYYFAIYFTTLYLVTHFLGPFLTITILNAVIFKAIRRAKYERSRLSSSKFRDKHQTTRMITVVTIIFVICNTLPFVLNVWEVIDGDLFRGDRRLIAYLTLDISNVLVVLNSSTTFLIYFMYCQKYRSIIVNRFFPSCQRNLIQRCESSELCVESRTEDARATANLSLANFTRSSAD